MGRGAVVAASSLSSLGSGDGIVIRIGLDSCACVSIIPDHLFIDYPTRMSSGATYKTANGMTVTDGGSRQLVGWIRGSAKLKAINFRIGKINRPLLAASEVTDRNYRVILDSGDGVDCSQITNRVIGESLTVERLKGVYEIRMRVVPYAQAVLLLAQLANMDPL